MWTIKNVKLILVSHGRLIFPPPGWRLSRQNVPHGRVGGVTDHVGHVGVYFRCDHGKVPADLGSSVEATRPRRDDLRAILKMAVGGNRCGSPEKGKHPSRSVGEVVKTIRPGVVWNCGLLEVKTNAGSLRLPRVKTPFGGDMWGIRPLTSAETLACWDVPEKLGQLL
jgi:hypothetical protein